MHPFYSLGYQSWQGAQFVDTVRELGARVGDARFMPRSRLPFWTAASLTRTLGDQYLPLPELGNRNYKGGPIAFVDLDAGLARVAQLLEEAPLILLCACRVVVKCHRYRAAQELEARQGIACMHLDPPATLFGRDFGTPDRPLPLMY